ncbi:hypothetical protein [Pseudomonas extremaustralis]|uniref:Uncharacterized protein n=2 Tax=Pseudomonas extremaustralis TaxID=359110 RepID=A0A5C5Q3X0_9PSED|nr:hypothetical protein [Pseudomonas extremaustralis]TWR95486.1 hypothetical protein FIV36_30975 [Pseudomonas extremaustralis]
MRRALFGGAAPATEAKILPSPPAIIDIVLPSADEAQVKKKVIKALTPRLYMTMQVTTEYEGNTFELPHEEDILSTLQAEQEAVRIAKKK